jgi:hypothetical protein
MERAIHEPFPTLHRELLSDVIRDIADERIELGRGGRTFLDGHTRGIDIHWRNEASLIRSIRPPSTAIGVRSPRAAASLQRSSTKRSQKAMCAKSPAAVQGGSISVPSSWSESLAPSAAKRSADARFRSSTPSPIGATLHGRTAHEASS